MTEDMEAGVLSAIDAIRPALQADGGDIEFVEINFYAMVTNNKPSAGLISLKTYFVYSKSQLLLHLYE